jgi:hypothetical protein
MSPKTKEEKRKEAEFRQARWASMGPRQKLELLDERLGKGKGAKKQRRKLETLIEMTRL